MDLFAFKPIYERPVSSLEILSGLPSLPLGQKVEQLPQNFVAEAGILASEIKTLLMRKNGFLAFDNALHVFPVGKVSHGYNLEQWNSVDLWRFAYGDILNGCLFFAEDVFGEQFCIRENQVWRFDPETALFERLAASLEEWAYLLLDPDETETGFQLAYYWQERFGLIPFGTRLVPIIPFFYGGDFSLENFQAVNALEAMRIKANIYHQIRELPDGFRIKLIPVDNSK